MGSWGSGTFDTDDMEQETDVEAIGELGGLFTHLEGFYIALLKGYAQKLIVVKFVRFSVTFSGSKTRV